MCEGSGSSTSLPTFGVFSLFNFSHSAGGCGEVLLKKKLFMTLVKGRLYSRRTAMMGFCSRGERLGSSLKTARKGGNL